MRRFAALAAAFAITLQALWPLIAQARPAERMLTVALCSAESAGHSIEIPVGHSTTGEEHCKMCVLGDGKDVDLLLSSFLQFLLAGDSNGRLADPEASFHPAPLHPAQPRAPPQIS